MAQATKNPLGHAERLAVALVLDHPVNAANEDKLVRLVTRLADSGIAHLSLVCDGALHPAAWHLDLKPVRRVDISAGKSAQHFSGGRFSLSVVPQGSGRSVVAAAVRALALAGERRTSTEQLDASVEEVAGPSPDLIIVAGGTPNLRGSLTWRAAYGEFVFCERPWTELVSADLDRALKEFAARGRRFGGIA